MTKKLKFVFILILFVLFLQPNPSSAQTLNGGVSETAGAVSTLITTSATEALTPFQTFTLHGDYITAGVGLRGRTFGAISISAIPAGSTVEGAYLYWSYLDNDIVLSESNLVFNGTPIVGTEIGSGPDTCWDRQFSRAFRADVTALVSGNGTYTISNVLRASPLFAQGASLVVIYKNGAVAEHTIVINDGNGVIDENTSNLSTTIGGFAAIDSSAALSAKTTFVVGDGQIFTDTITFTGGNGIFTANNTLDGNDGELWDTDTYNVSSFVAPGDISASATMSRGTDCLNWVAQVFSVTTGEEEEPIGTQAASLAKELLSSDYLYGGKGWDYLEKQFIPVSSVSGSSILGKYNFATSTGVGFDDGVDCSGLVMWAYNRSFDPNKSRFNNFVKAEGADEQFNENTEPVNESQLTPGDVLFSDFDGNGFIDHVAMFVGESGGFDVVSAVNPLTGIVGRLKDNLKKPEAGFVSFKRVVSALPPAVLIAANSPVDLTVTDPDGFTITAETIVPSDLEILRQIPGELYYSEMEQGSDGRSIDHVYSYTAKTGDYLIKVLPEPDALSTEIFSLSFTVDLATTTVLAENIPISDIPDQSYIIRASDDGIEKIIPVKVKITPKTLNLGNKGVFSTIIEVSSGFGVSVSDIDTETININGAFPVKTTVAAGRFLVATFRTQDLQNVQSGDKVELQISGSLNDGTIFEGTDTIRVISQGKFSSALGQFNQLASVLTVLQSLLSQLLELLQP